jgi:hypothetical protein
MLKMRGDQPFSNGAAVSAIGLRVPNRLLVSSYAAICHYVSYEVPLLGNTVPTLEAAPLLVTCGTGR